MSSADGSRGQSTRASPVPSTSKLPSTPSSLGPDDDVKSTSKRSSSPDTKGKGRALPGEDGGAGDVDGVKAEDGEAGDVKLNPEEEILLGAVPKAKIVGLKYARGIATLKKGMQVELRRDPYNVTDKNAIEVRHTKGGQRIGYLKKELAARLSNMVKERKIRLEAVAGDVPFNTVGLFEMPMRLEIWGKRKFASDARLDWLSAEKNAQRKAEKLKAEALKTAMEEVEADGGGTNGVNGKGGTSGGGAPAQGAAGGKSKQEIEREIAMRQSILLARQNKGDMLGDMFKEGAMDPAALPVHPCPPGRKDGTMRTDLLPFQRQGLSWMIKMEHPELPKTPDDPPVQMWTMKEDSQGEKFYHHIGTDTTRRKKWRLNRGGILADEMGLGKTMQTIALICTDDTGEGVLPEPEDPDEEYDDMTLIVCPLSVASNWTDQFSQHVGKKRLKWHFFHGEGRELSKKELRKYDIIITTYQTLAGTIEGDSRKSSRATSHAGTENDDEDDDDDRPAKKRKISQKDLALLEIKWRRVVLDEGHLIKNPKAKMSRACVKLQAERRWILTGTPIVNAVGDLGAMIQFLRVCQPLDEPNVWREYVAKGDDQERAKLLRAVVLSTTLRRTKDMLDSAGKPLISLPEVLYYKHEVELKQEIRDLYKEVEDEVGKNVKKTFEEGSSKASYTHILCLLLRLRQLACDPTLCPPEFIEDIRDRKLAARIQRDHESATGVSQGSLDAQQLSYLRTLLKEMAEAAADCLACGQWATEPRITICQHYFCQSCIESAVDAKGACPYCGLALSRDHIIAPPVDRGVSPSTSRAASVSSRHDSVSPVERTAKTEALITLLKSTPPGVKSLVFSQWTSHLDRIEAALVAEGITSCRFDGSMRQDKREEVIKSFTVPNKNATAGSKEDRKNPMVMLLSLKAGALGLNLTVASQVFLMDPWWQPAIEQQAIDRVNRIGQTKPVRIFQLVAKDTVEDRVLKIQAKKEALIAQAFSGHKNAGKSKSKIEVNDLAAIFNIKT
ncbi:SNF2 family helicase [Rhodotorula toruloides]|uniref:BY PROTMAP: gi/472583148/gb/EMS20802.1/ SNF2 family helicase [Rhodosporidium toruloides NP11] gi/647397369/emb/CDR40345.1/ RHTO0S05e01992g1_1 [Rhodosporidium toruloides] n=1 Tax=Rhodotorula toruloides TaxID=5286 RepID=A0A0K3CGJ5_RHOTO|nr:SNF2 family helicase [Rhodotorula toruloides]PRQ74652.1 SNF2 family N-terminal domain-domain containing protein [Rhodotorula toruloides]